MNNNKLKKNKVFEYFTVFVILFFVCNFINKNITIKGLYMDDLASWAWFPGSNIFDFAFKFYPTQTRYRPVYEVMQYIIYMLVGHSPKRFVYINIFINSLIALFIYFIGKKLNIGMLLSFMCSLMYIISHFAYYQIGAGIGILESLAQFFALIILYLSVSYINSKNKNRIFVLMMIFYFLITFTHERFLSMGAVIVFVLFIDTMINFDDNEISVKRKKKQKFYDFLKKLSCFFILLLFILFIRYISIGKVLPAGTGGTYVENTFNLFEAFGFAIDQVKFIFGMNTGYDYLVGIDFQNADLFIKKLCFFSVFCILLVIILYLYLKINYLSKNIYDKKHKLNYIFKNFYVDFIFLLFIAMCIGCSSITIRVEMRFVYVSFTASVLYLCYIISDILSRIQYKKLMNIIMYILIFGFYITRSMVEIYYRSYFDNIYFFLDQQRVNSLIENTVDKYGINEALHEKDIYILYNFYNMTDFYCKYILSIYDTNYESKKINIAKTLEDLPKDYLENDNVVVLIEGEDFRSYKSLK